MNKTNILAVVRHILTFAGGFLVTKGLADDAMVTELVGAIIAVAGVVWSILEKKAVAAAAAAAAPGNN